MLAAAAGLAGCVGHARSRAAPAAPPMPRTLAVELAGRSAEVARRLERHHPCLALAAARRLQRQTIVAINRGHVPGGLQETLQSSVNELVSRIRCAAGQSTAPADQARRLAAWLLEHSR